MDLLNWYNWYMWYMILFFVTNSGYPVLQIDPTPYLKHNKCIVESRQLHRTLKEHFKVVVVGCRKLPIRRA